METLEFKHLAPYLPYGLKMNYGIHYPVLCGLNNADSVWLKYIDGTTREQHISDYKPILRPLSDLKKEIEHSGEKFVPIDWLNENKSVSLIIGIRPNTGEETVFNERTNSSNIRFFEHCIIEKLLEWHFDIFNLLSKNLAIDINTLNQ
jgi:hypothetical protein